MLGGIIGDIIGSIYEDGNIKSKAFPLWSDKCHFTDDTVLTIATADWLLNGGRCEDYYYSYTGQFPSCGYGTNFLKWYFNRKFHKEYKPYNSYGNGSAMRVGPVGWAFDSLELVMQYSKISAQCTHNHEEGIKGAQTIAACVFLARMRKTKEDIKRFVEDTFNYDVSISLEKITQDHIWNATCQQTVPQAIISFLESVNFEDSIRNAVSVGGDSDTIACMTGSISEAFYGVPIELRKQSLKYLPPSIINVINMFENRFGK